MHKYFSFAIYKNQFNNYNILYIMSGMGLSAVQTLVEGLVDIVIENRIIIEGLIDKYLRKQKSNLIENNEMESEDFEGPMTTLDLIQEEEQQQQATKNNVFNYYLEEHKQILIQQHPDYSMNQIIAKAAADFKNLDNASKVPYIRAYLKNHKCKTNSIKYSFDEEVRPNYTTNAISSNYSHFPFNSYYSVNNQDQYSKRINMNAIFRPNFQDQYHTPENFNDYKNSKEINMGETTSSYRKERGEKDLESRLKYDQKNGQRDKVDKNTNNLHENEKEKSEFQTLRSLFKKLQSNT